MRKNKLILSLVLLILISLTTAFVSAGEVAYVYRLDSRLDQNFVNALTEKGFTVDLIKYAYVTQTDFSNYDFILVGDEPFSDPSLIPINQYPSVIVNSYHMDEWSWIDNNGISVTASNQPLRAKNVVSNSITNGLPDTIQIYSQCCHDESSIGLSAYYMSRFSKDFDILTVTSTNTIPYQDSIIGIAEPGDVLFGGTVVQARGCFFGIVKSDYWTNDAKTLFQNCASWAAFGADKDGDGYHAEQDCDDNNADVNPAATESCNGIDDNCNGEIDEEDALGCTIYYYDFDNDGHGINDNKCLCSSSYPYDSTTNDDCDDTDNTIYPGATEIPYDSIDQDCNNEDLIDVDNDSYDYTTDCDDNDPNVNPGQTEIPLNGKDDDCNPTTLDDDPDNDNIESINDNCPSIYNPGQEDEDNDNIGDVCDLYLNDFDNDGYNETEDCNDQDPNTYPGAVEILDNIDQNCMNDPPYLEDFAEINVIATLTAEVTAIGHDYEGDSLTYEINNPEFTQNNNIFTYQTTLDQAGTTITVTITVSDGEFTDSKQATINILPKIVINEFVLDPQTDWSNNGNTNNHDRWIELFNPSDQDVDLNNWKLSLGTFTLTDNPLSGTLYANDYYVLLDPNCQVQYSAGQIVLYNNDVEVDSVTYGNLNDGSLSDNAFRYEGINASGIEDECIARMPNGHDTDIDNEDWFKQQCTYEQNNEADLISPVVILITPLDSSVDDDGDVIFTFEATDDHIVECSLYTDINNIFEIQDTMTVNSDYIDGGFTVNNIPDNKAVTWNVQCTDNWDNDAFAQSDYIVNININDPPVLDHIDDITVNETDTIVIVAIATDEETSQQDLIYYINDIRFTQSQFTFTFQTSYSDGETFTVLITVSDGELNTSQEVTITILNNDNDNDSYDSEEDCDDNNDQVYPGATELDNGIDDNCDGNTDEGYDSDSDGYTPYSGDCDDNDPNINPAASESCNNIDDNCDNQIDEDLTQPTTCGVGECSDNTGFETCSAGSWIDDTCDPFEDSSEETCDNLDNDCDGLIDEDLTQPTTCGVGECSDNTGFETCSAGSWIDDTCDPFEGAASEACNGLDDDCDNQIDEELTAPLNSKQDGVCQGSKQTCTGTSGWTDDYSQVSNYEDPEASCDLLDNDCDGEVDEDLMTTYYQDSDSDNYGNNAVTQDSCTQPQGYVSDNTDCDDTTASVNPAATEACNNIDDNCNNEIDEGCDDDNDDYCDISMDYVVSDECLNGYNDCDDNNADVNPAAQESCNGLDDNCNGEIDEENALGCTVYYLDNDDDNYGLECHSKCLCSPEDPYDSTTDTDCDDDDINIHPNMDEFCNGIDDDCDGEIDEEDAYYCTVYYYDFDNDGYGLTSDSKCLCSTDDPYDTTVSGDCNDNDPTIYPGALEIPYDGVDQDCSSSDLTDVDGDGYDYTVDCDDSDPNIHPNADEFCNGIDDDCDTEIDEENSVDCTIYYLDNDDDTYGTTATKCLCSAQDPYDTTVNSDCDDNDSNVNPSQTEIAYNGKDDDCNSATLDDDLDQDGYPLSTDCDDNDPNINPGMTELCNDKDDNCNTQIDEGCDDDNDDYCDSSLIIIGTPTVCPNGGNDCNDNDPTIYPGATETPYDNIDQDCNGKDLADVDNDGYNYPEDCNDNDPNINPGATETPYNGIDEDCDGSDLIDVDNDGYDHTQDCNDNDPTIYPGAPETPYDGIDQDCDGSDLTDVDGDSYDYTTDCDDNDPNVNPGQTEIPNNGKDDDCNPATLDGDSDQDGIIDDNDNCPTVYNPLQEDSDYDGIGDACDQYPNDYDNDGIDDNIDNCPTIYNPNQEDLDQDGIGDVCEHQPVLNVYDITVIEGETVVIEPEVYDLDGDSVLITISEPVGNDGIWETKVGDKGTYEVTITAFDGLFTVTKTITIRVKEKPYEAIQLSRIRFNDDVVRPGETLQLYVTLEGAGNVKSKDVKITAVIPELGIYKSLGRFDLKRQQSTKKLFIDIPTWAPKGEYELRIVISNDNIRRVRHRPIFII